MRLRLIFATIWLVLAALATHAEAFLEFDHVGDDRKLLHQEPINGPLTIVCQIEIDQLRHSGGSHPAIELWLSEYDGTPWHDLSGSLGVFATFKTPLNKNFNYTLSTWQIGRDYSQGLEWYEAGEHLTRMTFRWKDDGILTFFVGEDESTAQHIRYSKFSPKFWSVTVARTKGRISCSREQH